ncbi:MIR1, partial [Symbiodinium necroappetens]
SDGTLQAGREAVVNDGISWNFAAAVVRSDTVGCPSRADYPPYPIEAEALANLEALVCFSDSTRRDAARPSQLGPAGGEGLLGERVGQLCAVKRFVQLVVKGATRLV